MPSNASAQLHAIAAKLKEVGDRGLKLELTRGLRAGADPLVQATHAAALAKLPKSGGLNAQVAGQKVTVSVRTGARTAGVRLTTRAPDTKQTDSGYVRSPTFGRRGKGDWKTHEIPQATGWWSDTLATHAPAVTPVLLAQMEAVAAQIRAV
jgi:hypothetical protein